MHQKTPTRANVIVLKQVLNLIPRHLIHRHARETGVDAKARTFSVTSHLSAMLFAQLSRAIGLNDRCDWMRFKCAALVAMTMTPTSATWGFWSFGAVCSPIKAPRV